MSNVIEHINRHTKVYGPAAMCLLTVWGAGWLGVPLAITWCIWVAGVYYEGWLDGYRSRDWRRKR